ncbi:MAG: deoxyribodipyrimidine photo-lyase/cryptochrome family protein [Pseudomonadota bacterium]
METRNSRASILVEIQVTWFKRDFRLADNAALSAAARKGPVLPLFIYEPESWAQPDRSGRQDDFMRGALASLKRDVVARGGAVSIRVGRVTSILEDLLEQFGHFALHAHEETGNLWSFSRDEAVRRWCRNHKVSFTEYRQFGIERGGDTSRNGWAKRWDAMMEEPVLPEPPVIDWVLNTQDPLPPAKRDPGVSWVQAAGRGAAEAALHSFLRERGEFYQKDMSTPVAGETACSRISPHLVWGSMSMREMFQATVARQNELREGPVEDRGFWLKSLNSFVGRLHWHCHFSQKLEDQPDLETTAMIPAYDALRESNAERLERYATGHTGFPFVDACMRYLAANGWINFRMRAMLVSFASYDLWLPWQESGHVLARLFTDYDAGIHWPQVQMQSGVTGINTIRVYSPVKQGLDQDPTGDFTRYWVPELAHIPGKAVHELTSIEAMAANYPTPVIDHKEATRFAKDQIFALRRDPELKAQAAAIMEKHGSRKRQPRRRRA